mmetsp:Transcript_26847/g.63694  ORF Transcript_26847/g.63694 Transcript_26847/m.63694 type:complete len:355 (-) Transcript_26847:5054-6118(-)
MPPPLRLPLPAQQLETPPAPRPRPFAPQPERTTGPPHPSRNLALQQAVRPELHLRPPNRLGARAVPPRPQKPRGLFLALLVRVRPPRQPLQSKQPLGRTGRQLQLPRYQQMPLAQPSPCSCWVLQHPPSAPALAQHCPLCFLPQQRPQPQASRQELSPLDRSRWPPLARHRPQGRALQRRPGLPVGPRAYGPARTGRRHRRCRGQGIQPIPCVDPSRPHPGAAPPAPLQQIWTGLGWRSILHRQQPRHSQHPWAQRGLLRWRPSRLPRQQWVPPPTCRLDQAAPARSAFELQQCSAIRHRLQRVSLPQVAPKSLTRRHPRRLPLLQRSRGWDPLLEPPSQADARRQRGPSLPPG